MMIRTILFLWSLTLIANSLTSQSNVPKMLCEDKELSTCLTQKLSSTLTPIIEISDCLEDQVKLIDLKLRFVVDTSGFLVYKSFLAPFTLPCYKNLKSESKVFLNEHVVDVNDSSSVGEMTLKLSYNKERAKKLEEENRGPTEEILSSMEVYSMFDEPPLFGGCKDKACSDEKLIHFIQENMVYPLEARRKGIQGIVYVSFIVNKQGKVEETKLVRDIGGGCGEATLKVVNAMNDLENSWSPGLIAGKAVRVYYTLPATFMLEEKKKK